MADPRRKRLGVNICWLIVVALWAPPAFLIFSTGKEDVLDVTVRTLKRGHVEQSGFRDSSGTVKRRMESIDCRELFGKNLGNSG